MDYRKTKYYFGASDITNQKNKLLKKYCGTKRLLLCASKLSFPLSGKEKIVRIALPDYFEKPIRGQ